MALNKRLAAAAAEAKRLPLATCLIIDLPGLLVESANAFANKDRWHYAAYKKHCRRAFKRALYSATLPSGSGRLSEHRVEGPCALSVECVRQRRIRDHANLVAGCKPLLDLLQEFGFIADDDDKTLPPEHQTYTQHMGGRPAVRVVLKTIRENQP